MNTPRSGGTAADIGRGKSPAAPNSDRNAIAQKIILDITRGALAFGQRIPEADYAQAFGVSRTPVRDALMMLSSLDLVTVRPKYGTFVTSFTRTRLYEVFDARYLFESGGVELANPYQRGRLLVSAEALLTEMQKTGEGETDHEANHDTDTAFHRLLVEASGNAQLSKMYRPIEVCALAARSRLPREDWIWQTAVAHHEAIIEGIRSDDIGQFKSALKTHLHWSRDALLETSEIFTPG